MIKKFQGKAVTFLMASCGLFLCTSQQLSAKNQLTQKGREILQNDWLFQAGNNVSKKTLLKEYNQTKSMIERLSTSYSKLDFITQKEKLKNLKAKIDSAFINEKELYFELRKLKREVMMANPAINFDKLLFIDQPYPLNNKYGAWAGGPREWAHEARHRNGLSALSGGKLLVLNGLNPDGKVTNLIPNEYGALYRPDISYDGKKIIFCFKPENDKAYHIYEVNADGTNLKQLTFGDYDDLDPIYLPDGKLMFSTTRANSYIRCMPQTASFQLARCDSDGKNIYVISRNNECDFTPAVMNDGRILYTRWEYTDKALWRVQSLWATNPDGTNTVHVWGNQSIWPDMLTEARQIPNSTRLIFTANGHHGWFDGSIGILDPEKGMNYPKGLTQVTTEVVWPETGKGPHDVPEKEEYLKAGKHYAYKTPYPLSEELFLVSARIGGHLYNQNHDPKTYFSLYLMDTYGNKELIYKGEKNVYHAVPLMARQKPPIIPDRVVWPKIDNNKKDIDVADGILYSQNIFENADDIPRDKAKYLRVIEMDPKTYTSWRKQAQHDGPSVGITQAETVKRILGTVPIEKDGSVYFRLPAGKAVYFQVLDKDYQCIKNMRSFTGVMPGEIRGCVGCHEGQTNAPSVALTQGKKGFGLAFRKAPVTLIPPPWGDIETIGYERFVQPLLDKYCISCHDGSDNKASKKINLKFRDSNRRVRYDVKLSDKPLFAQPYVDLVGGGVGWGRAKNRKNIAGVLVVEGYAIQDPESLKTLPAYSHFSAVSQLVKIASSGMHHKVKMSDDELRRLRAWVDCNGPYLGLEEIRQMNDPLLPDVERVAVRPRVGTAPIINRFNIRQDGDSFKVAGCEASTIFDKLKVNNWAKNANIEVISATYGANNKTKDVTKYLKNSFKKQPYALIGNFNKFFGGDPAPQVMKNLKIIYRVNGVVGEITVKENGFIMLKKLKNNSKKQQEKIIMNQQTVIILGADDWGKGLKNAVEKHLKNLNYTIIDANELHSENSNYYEIAEVAVKKIQDQKAKFGILFCGTGMGMSVVANKHNGIVAAVVESPFGARMARAVNNANVLAMGGMILSEHQAILATDNFLNTNLADGLEQFKDFLSDAIEKVDKIDDENRKLIYKK
ncbi:RpiB/LacA/LacB family sugar-phosphate isomerase [Lentisphaerota bacterium WC36G]|nr:RpiB/LacA/LacB family sugar-phosphate isomerase [Lentisphaerae bacterium WC36]